MTLDEEDLNLIISGVALQLRVEHGEGNWTTASLPVSPVTITQDTLDINGNAIGRMTGINSIPLVGAIMAAYVSTDTNHTNALYTTITDGDGGYALVVGSGATYHIACVVSGKEWGYKVVTV